MQGSGEPPTNVPYRTTCPLIRVILVPMVKAESAWAALLPTENMLKGARLEPMTRSSNGGSNRPTETKSRPCLETGVPGLDYVLGGGLPAGHLYLLEGDPGTGKTTIALQFLLDGVRRGETVLYITLSESKVELLSVAASHGWNMDGVVIFEMSPDDALDPEAQYTVFHPSEVEFADTIASVLERVEQLNPRRVVFDSLSELRMLAREALPYRRQILGLKRYFSGRECTVLLLDDHTAGAGDLQLQSIAHGVIILESLQRDYGTNRRRLEVRKLRGAVYREGFHDYTINTGGVCVTPRLIAAEHKHGFASHMLSSGLKELDDLLGGGLDAGTSTLMMGPAGSGKSTVATLYVHAALSRGENCAILSFDESISTLVNRSASLNIDLSLFLKSGQLRLRQVDPAEMSPGQLATFVRDAVQEMNIAVLVIDSINGLLASMPDESFLSLQLHELLTYLGQQGVATILTLAQHGIVGSDMFSPIDISYLADSVVLFRYFEFNGEIKKAISVVKKRSGVHERIIRELTLANNHIRVGQPLSQFEGILTGVPTFTGDRADLARGEGNDSPYRDA